MTSAAATAQTLSSSPKAFYGPVEVYLPTVKEKLLAIVPPESQLLALSLAHALGTGGKLLRPAMGLLIAKALGNVDDTHLETATVSELIHIATLLHDDVLDDADIRRGKPTVSHEWGNTVSILSGDYLLAQASRKLAQVGNIRVVAIFSEVLADLCDGEVEQLRTRYQLDAVSWESYERKSICKTATLFSAVCEAMAVLHGQEEETIQHLRGFGEAFGIAFQIVDDLLDYTATAEEMGKPVLDDLRQGLLNAPVLLALESETLSAAQNNDLRQAIAAVFEAGQAEAPPPGEALDTIQSLLKQSGVFEQTQALAQRYVQRALEHLAVLPQGEATTALSGLTQFITQRSA